MKTFLFAYVCFSFSHFDVSECGTLGNLPGGALLKAMRVVGWVLRFFFHNARDQSCAVSEELTFRELCQARV